jgi:hypothetical protein
MEIVPQGGWIKEISKKVVHGSTIKEVIPTSTRDIHEV